METVQNNCHVSRLEGFDVRGFSWMCKGKCAVCWRLDTFESDGPCNFVTVETC